MNLQGKIINVLGDSITQGVGVSCVENAYQNVMGRIVGAAEVRNFGISGTRLARQYGADNFPWPFTERFKDMPDDADLVIIFGGTNDYGHGDAPFGKLGDTDRGTYCGAVRWLMNKLTEMYPNSKIVFMTPARRLGDEKPSQSLHRYYPSLLLRDYVDVIIETAKDFDIHVLDLYTQLGIDPNGEEDRVKYTAEGLHFNDAGHRVIAQRLKEFLETI